MVRTRKERKAAAEVKLAQPDRSGPSEQTLLDLALERNLFDQADRHPANRRRKNGSHGEGDEGDDGDDGELSPTADRIVDALLWTVSLAMLHFTLDVLVQHQYAMEIVWPDIVTRAFLALIVFFVFFYVLHPHPSSPVLLPGLPLRYQAPLRQAIFFVASTVSGCYLIEISNNYGYMYIMKRSPPLGCLWVWSVIELNLAPALASLAIACGFFYQVPDNDTSDKESPEPRAQEAVTPIWIEDATAVKSLFSDELSPGNPTSGVQLTYATSPTGNPDFMSSSGGRVVSPGVAWQMMAATSCDERRLYETTAKR
ncbi:hypothetical protein F5X97DRAFT_320625 [Nemania serpens]|nr:hypothetical protein F5X97DRAFT_320625 [Nemania serpens]